MADDLAQGRARGAHLKPGQRLQVEVTADGGLLLRPIRLDALVGSHGAEPATPHKASLKDAGAIDEAVAAAVAHWDRVTSGRDDDGRA